MRVHDSAIAAQVVEGCDLCILMGVEFVAGPAGGANTVPGVGRVGVVVKEPGRSEMDVTREGFAVLSWVGITSVVFRWSCIKKVTPTLQVMRLLAVGVMTADGLVEGCKTMPISPW